MSEQQPEANVSTSHKLIAKSKTPEDWKGLAAIIRTLVDEATFEANEDGLTMRGMDPSHIALIDVYWPKEGFEQYECTGPLKFGVKLDEISKILKRADKKDSVRITIGETDDSQMHIGFIGGYKREYKARLIEISTGATPIPRLNFNAKATISTALLDKILSDVQVVSEYVSIEAKNKDQLKFSGRGDSGEVNLDVLKDGLIDGSTMTAEVKEESKANYSLGYLAKAISAMISGGADVQNSVIEFSSKMPIKIEFSTKTGARIHYYLAPRVQD